MSKQSKRPRNRLADLLFLGGGLSAAALIVAYQTGSEPRLPPDPQPTQQVQQVSQTEPTPVPTPEEQVPEPCLTNHPAQPKQCLVERDPFQSNIPESTLRPPVHLAGAVAIPEPEGG